MNQADDGKRRFWSADAQVARAMRFDWAAFTGCTVTLNKQEERKKISAARRERPRILRGWRVLGVGGHEWIKKREKKGCMNG